MFGISESYFMKTFSVFYRSAWEITLTSCLDCLLGLANPLGEIGYLFLLLIVAEAGTCIEELWS